MILDCENTTAFHTITLNGGPGGLEGRVAK